MAPPLRCVLPPQEPLSLSSPETTPLVFKVPLCSILALPPFSSPKPDPDLEFFCLLWTLYSHTLSHSFDDVSTAPILLCRELPSLREPSLPFLGASGVLGSERQIREPWILKMLRPNTWALTVLIAFGYSSAALGWARGPSGSVCWPVDCDSRAPVWPRGTRPHAGPAFLQWRTCWSGVSLPGKGAPSAGTTPRPPPPNFSHRRPQCGVTGGRVSPPSAVAEMGVPSQP